MSASPGYARERSIAALATLQPGIEPVFLVVLTSAIGLPPGQYGWVVGAGQAGMAMGSILCWGGGLVATRGVAMIAAAIALIASLVMVDMEDLAAIATLRVLFGLCVGLIFTRSTGIAAREKPGHAFGTIFLVQLLLSTGVTALLPLAADLAGPTMAIRLLACCPALILLLLFLSRPAGAAQPIVVAIEGERRPLAPAPATAAAALAMFLFICVTMMLWSYVGAMGATMALSDGAIGIAVAVGSLSGVVPAIVASYRPRRWPASLIGLLCGLAMMTPLLAFVADLGETSFVASISLFNIGSTFAIIRFSGMAISPGARGRSRRLIAALHCVGMASGPLIAAVAVGANGYLALGIVAGGALVAAIAGLFAAEAGGASGHGNRPMTARQVVHR